MPAHGGEQAHRVVIDYRCDEVSSALLDHPVELAAKAVRPMPATPCPVRAQPAPITAQRQAQPPRQATGRRRCRGRRGWARPDPPAQIDDFSADSLHAFLGANLATGATAGTDGWVGYPGASSVTHDPHVVENIAAHVVLPWVHRVFANLKTWALGVYHGLRRQHLQSYLDEFVFRFNRRRTRYAAFRSILDIGVAIKPAT